MVLHCALGFGWFFNSNLVLGLGGDLPVISCCSYDLLGSSFVMII